MQRLLYQKVIAHIIVFILLQSQGTIDSGQQVFSPDGGSGMAAVRVRGNHTHVHLFVLSNRQSGK